MSDAQGLEQRHPFFLFTVVVAPMVIASTVMSLAGS